MHLLLHFISESFKTLHACFLPYDNLQFDKTIFEEVIGCFDLEYFIKKMVNNREQYTLINNSRSDFPSAIQINTL